MRKSYKYVQFSKKAEKSGTIIALKCLQIDKIQVRSYHYEAVFSLFFSLLPLQEALLLHRREPHPHFLLLLSCDTSGFESLESNLFTFFGKCKRIHNKLPCQRPNTKNTKSKKNGFTAQIS